MARQGSEQAGHHLQVNHRRLVDHQHVQRQRVAGVVTEVTAVRQAAEQAVQGGDLAGDLLAHLIRHRQRGDLGADGFGQPRGGLAGGRGQTDTQRLTGGQCRLLQQRQQAHHRGGLAGAGAAGDQAEAAACGQRAGELLPVGQALAVQHQRLGKQPGQARGQLRRQHRRIVQPRADGRGHRALVAPVAAQVQALAVQHQRRLFPGAIERYQRATAQGLQPLRQIDATEDLRGQQRGARSVLAFRRQRQGEVRIGQGRRQIQADVAVAELVAGQRAGEQRQRRALLVQLVEEGHQRTVEGAQPAALDPGVQQRQQAGAVVQFGGRRRLARQQGQLFAHATSSTALPLNSASSASISSRGGRAWWMPCPAARLPRRNR